MDFNLSREHQMLRKMMASFTENEVKPIAAETDRTCTYPKENIDKLRDYIYKMVADIHAGRYPFNNFLW